jgi:hypothetical protein
MMTGFRSGETFSGAFLAQYRPPASPVPATGALLTGSTPASASAPAPGPYKPNYFNEAEWHFNALK